MTDADNSMTIKLGSGENEISIWLLNAPIEKNAVGMVECALFDDRVVLAVDPRPEEERGYQFAGLSYAEGSPVGLIYMEDQIYQGLKKNGIMEKMILLHELGHYCYHHWANRGEDSSRLDQLRMEAVEQDQVYADERQADEFAAGYLGFQAAADGLEKLKQECVIRYGTDQYHPEDAAVAIRELDLRILHLRQCGQEISCDEESNHEIR